MCDMSYFFKIINPLEIEDNTVVMTIVEHMDDPSSILGATCSPLSTTKNDS